MLYRNYDQAGLDAQYNMREAVPEFPDFVARWNADSADARARLACRLELAYGRHPRERLDYVSCGVSGAPLHVFIHGGYWQAMDKASFTYIAEGLVPHGFDVAVIDYVLAPEVTVGAIVEQCRDALAWLYRNAADLGFDPSGISVSGHSAGGHLTAMMVLTDWTARDPALPADLLRGGLAISGLYDLEPIRLSYLNEALGLDAEAARRSSPIHAIADAAPPAPLHLAVGGDETPEFHRQQDAFREAWQARGWPVSAVAMPGTNHFSVVDALARPDSPLVSAVRGLHTPR